MRSLANILTAIACAVAAWTVLGIALPAQAAILQPVHVESGVLQGVPGYHAAVTVFKGIPYAAPPVGPLRWRPPQPPVAWQRVRKADEFGAECMQRPQEPGSFYQREFYPIVEPVSEDCLFQNVWTAASSSDERRPVMLWIHGGGFGSGSGAMPSFNGEALALKGVVVVTINYRLGLFGFFSHPDLGTENDHHVSGNYGLLDMVAALQWVKRNIAEFGGDPTLVTIFGQSAGGSAVLYLDASPLAKGLFQRAISESGPYRLFSTLRDAEVAGAAYMVAAGASSLAALRAIPAAALMKIGGRGGGGPIVDGYVVLGQFPALISENKLGQVPLMAGSNAMEGSTLTSPIPTLEAYRDRVKKSYAAVADEFLKLYPVNSDSEVWGAQIATSADDFAWPGRLAAKARARTGSKDVYLYYFDKEPAGPDSSLHGAFHSSEIVYVFNNLDAVDRPWTGADRKVADVMSSYWVNFARSGNPNGKGLPVWQPYDLKSDLSQELGDKIGPVALPKRSRLDVVEKGGFGSLR